MGSEAASTGARSLIERGVAGLASFGMAGGLDPALSAGDILIPAEIVTTDGRRFQASRDWHSRLCEALAARSAVRSDALLTAARAVGSVEDKSKLFQTTGAAAVDMESAAIAEIAAQHRLPFVAVRVIVDSAVDVLPRSVTAAADAARHLQIGRLLGALVLSPADLGRLVRLAKRYRAASRSLARVASTGVLASGLQIRTPPAAA
jgi:adenosylhomocysteine nucleosidase